MKKLLLIVSFVILFSAQAAQAQSVDLLYQGDGYTPPFYKGRALWSKQSQAIVYAVPSIPGVANPLTLKYRWIKNGTSLGNVNGVGKNFLTFYDDIFSKPVTIKIEILTTEDELLATNSMTLTPIAPTLLIYELNPLYGYLFNNEVGANYTIKNQEVTFATFPFLFTAGSRFDAKLIHEWSADGGEKQVKNMVTYRAPSDAAGTSRVSAHTRNTDKIIQDIQRSFTVTFGAKSQFE